MNFRHGNLSTGSESGRSLAKHSSSDLSDTPQSHIPKKIIGYYLGVTISIKENI